jgi:hypothetical protein
MRMHLCIRDGTFGCGPFQGEDHAVSDSNFQGYKLIQLDDGKDTLERQVSAQQQLFLILNMYKSMVNYSN